MRRFIAAVALTALSATAWASQDVVNTVHNLSTSGPGAFKSLNIEEVCVFCHTPHNASPVAPLWNRELSGATYLEYESTTLDAAPGQPTGSARLCLACHDGTVALGAFLKPPSGQTNDLSTTLLTGRGELGTDLGDDHPISFPYDTTLASQDPRLASPAGIDLPLENGQLQCMSCHDPHEKDLAPFMRKTTLSGALCVTCHTQADAGWDWLTSSHATSTKTPTGATPWPERKPEWRGANVGENSCFNCHKPHTAATPERLIKAQEENTCYLCHDATVATTDIEADFLKQYRHPVDATPNLNHDAEINEDPQTVSLHAECEDCHNPHAAASAPPMISFNPTAPTAPHTTAPLANARIVGVKGVDVNGLTKQNINFQYELCFKCHGLPGRSACDSGRCTTATSLGALRQDGVYNLREKVYSGTPGLISYHPIESNNPSNNSEVPSLRTDVPLNRIDSLIYCTDCHSGDAGPAAGGSGPSGPHGSDISSLMTQEYPSVPEIVSTSATYEVCYKCHNEATLMADASGFPHNRHVGRADASCSICHDPHGSHEYPHLINFLTEFNGAPYVEPVGQNTEPIWTDNGVFAGSCELLCHGNRHNGRRYK